ncbi:MAG: histidinol-phosphatase [Acutalibacteraceae bacterium]|nr:histidinol-phosphatase [Acutalibacteraceae bacterium]
MYKSNCHTHTLYCDGKNTAREMIESAIKKRFNSLGFSCHSPMIYNSDWAIKKEDLSKYIDELNALKAEYKDRIEIYCGVEVDSDFCDISLDNFDYTIGSVHQFIKNGKVYEIDYTAERLKSAADDLYDGDIYRMCASYFDMVSEFICNNDLDVVGHIDLVTKFNESVPMIDESNKFYQSSAINAINRILECKPDIIFEVNTGAMYRNGNKKPYPAPFIMKHLFNKGAKITITSDSHCCESLDFAFEEVYDYCKSFGFRYAYFLKNGKFEKFDI